MDVKKIAAAIHAKLHETSEAAHLATVRGDDTSFWVGYRAAPGWARDQGWDADLRDTSEYEARTYAAEPPRADEVHSVDRPANRFS